MREKAERARDIERMSLSLQMQHCLTVFGCRPSHYMKPCMREDQFVLTISIVIMLDHSRLKIIFLLKAI